MEIIKSFEKGGYMVKFTFQKNYSCHKIKYIFKGDETCEQEHWQWMQQGGDESQMALKYTMTFDNNLA